MRCEICSRVKVRCAQRAPSPGVSREGRAVRIVHRHQGIAEAVAYSPDSSLLASAGEDGVRTSPSRSEQPLRLQGITDVERVASLAFMPHGQRLAVLGDFGALQLWSFPEHCVLATHAPAEGGPVLGNALEGVPTESNAWAVWELAYHPERRLAAGSYCVGMSNPRYVLLWELGPPPRRRALWQHDAFLPAIELSPSGRLIASGSWDRTLVVGDTTTGQAIARWSAPGRVNCLLFLDDDTLLAGVGFSIVCLDVPSLSPRWKLAAHRNRITALAVSGDRRTLISASDDQTVATWDLATRRSVFCFHFPTWTDAHHCLAVAPDGQTAAVAGQNGDVAVWDLDD